LKYSCAYPLRVSLFNSATAMKTAVVFVALLALAAAAEPCTSNAFVCKFKEIGNTIKDHAISLGSKLATVGTSILDAVISSGTDILVQGSKGKFISRCHQLTAHSMGQNTQLLYERNGAKLKK